MARQKCSTIRISYLALNDMVINVGLKNGESKKYFIDGGVTLNNYNEEVRLLDRYETLIDKVSYTSSSEQIEIHF